MFKNLTPRITLKRIEGYTHRNVSGEFLNPDVCRGRKDGRTAPDAWSPSLQAIKAEEDKFRDDAHSMIKQTQAEARTRLEHIEDVLERNAEAQGKLKEAGELLPEPVARVQYSSAAFHIFLVGLLTIIDTAGVVYIAKQIFSGNILLFSSIGILMTAAVVFGVKALLEHLSPEKRAVAAKIVMGLGIALIVAGLLGFALLRTVTFDAALAGSSFINTEKISLGNLLFTLGLGLGVPLVLGVIFEKELSRKRPAQICLDLYNEQRERSEEKTEWTALLKRAEEIDASVDDITANVIKLRQNRYVRGYVKGIGKKPDAKNYLDAILKRDSGIEPITTGGN